MHTIRLSWLHAVALALTLCVAIVGCASRPVPAEPAPITAEESRAIPVFRGSDGATVAYADLLAAACEAEVVIIGENHGHRVGNAWAATLFEDVIEKKNGWSTRPALSMEFFERDDQSRLDDYLKGVVDEATFRKKTERALGNYPPGHARMIEAAKKHDVPVIAANMPWQFVRFIRGKDYAALDTLTPEQKRLFRIPDAMVEGRYRKDHDELMGPMVDAELSAKKPASHGGSQTADKSAAQAEAPEMSDEEKAGKRKARLDGLFRVMQLWDWTMAESVADALPRLPIGDPTIDADKPPADHADPLAAATQPASEVTRTMVIHLKPADRFKPIIHIVGRFHSDFAGGMPQALQSLRPGTKMIIISVVDQSSATLNDDDKDRGDFVVYVGAEATPAKGP